MLPDALRDAGASAGALLMERSETIAVAEGSCGGLVSAALLAVLLSIIGTIQLFNEPVIMEAANSWMGKDFTPMMLTYNSMMGEISPSGSGPASAYSLLMALIAGVLAVVYALLQRRKGDA